MPKVKNVLLICGGGGTEHDISLVSAKYILDQLKKIEEVTPHYLCIERDGRRTNLEGQDCELRKAGEIFNRETEETITLDYAIPCIHGPPGENGMIQSIFELMGLPYLGAGPEASINCFNKVSTKIWLDKLGIANSPSTFLIHDDEENHKKALAYLKEQKDVFIKATHQGSSVGCYHYTLADHESDQTKLRSIISEAFTLSPYVLIEKTIKGRELEVSTFQMKGETYASVPGEINCPSGFYTFEEKYSEAAKTTTTVEAPGLSRDQVQTIQEMAKKAFDGLKLKDLSRIDFFLADDGAIYINEINTFPGHTPISMFPMMMEAHGVSYVDFLRDKILN